jgi:hypothetical protein
MSTGDLPEAFAFWVIIAVRCCGAWPLVVSDPALRRVQKGLANVLLYKPAILPTAAAASDDG